MKLEKISSALIILLSLSFSNLFAQPKVRSAGIGLRGSYWKMSNLSTRITVSNYDGYSSVNVGGAGAWLFMFSRVNYNMLIELSLGAIARVEEETVSYTDNNVDVFAITPLLLGLRYELFSPTNPSAFRPYISFGAGPYVVSQIMVRDRLYEEQVTINTNLKRGGYAGGGFNFMLTDWFAVNFDIKYHFINFNVNNEYSGPEYGLGFSFMWGSFKQ